MESSNNILKELQELSPVLASSYPVPLPYSIPAGYFEQLAPAIQFIVKDNDVPADEELGQLSPLLKSISKTPPFHLPEGYFSDLSENTVAETKAVAFVQEELDDFSTLLNPLKNAPVYEVPAGYFEQLPAAILHKVREGASAKVVKIPLLKRMRKYAAAAVVALVLVSGGWWFLNSNSGSSTVSAAGIEKVSDDELVHFLEDQVITPENNNTGIAATSVDASSVQDLFSEVSDEELQQYYDKNSSLIKVISN